MTAKATISLGRKAELREFLKTRRARLSPADVNLPETTRRRTPGLRREEVAKLAGVGVSWYTWLEQGRDINVSTSVVDAICRALRLDDAERTHLYRLTGLPSSDSLPPTSAARRQARRHLERLVEEWLPCPAYVIDRYWNVLAANRTAHSVFGFSDDANCLATYFCSPERHQRYPDFDQLGQMVVSHYRAAMAACPDDPGFARIVGKLIEDSAEFAAIWSRYDVDDASYGLKTVVHPAAGSLELRHTLLALTDSSEHRLVLHSPADEISRTGLELLTTRTDEVEFSRAS